MPVQDEPECKPGKLQYQGQLVWAEDFKSDQEYYDNLRKEHNKSVHNSGIVKGLEIKLNNPQDDFFKVTLGMALDKDGQEIIVLEDTDRVSPDKESPKLKLTNDKNFVTISYQSHTQKIFKGETKPYPKTAGVSRDTTKPTDNDEIFIEDWYEINVSQTPPKPEENKILLAVVTKDGTGQWKPDYKDCIYSGSMASMLAKNVHIGSSDSPASIKYENNPEGGTRLLISCDNNDNDTIGFKQNGTEQLTLYKGNIGVGNTKPTHKLDVNGDLNVAGPVLMGPVGSPASIKYENNPGGGTRLLIACNNKYNDTIGFMQNGAEQLTLFNGNIGIGIPTPAHQLDINGDLNVTGPVLSNSGIQGYLVSYYQCNEPLEVGDMVAVKNKVDIPFREDETPVFPVVKAKENDGSWLCGIVATAGTPDTPKFIVTHGPFYQCKVDTSTATGNGPIEAGDLLVVSRLTGCAMKALDDAKRGTIIGRALKNMPGSDIPGKIPVLVNIQ